MVEEELGELSIWEVERIRNRLFPINQVQRNIILSKHRAPHFTRKDEEKENQHKVEEETLENQHMKEKEELKNSLLQMRLKYVNTTPVTTSQGRGQGYERQNNVSEHQQEYLIHQDIGEGNPYKIEEESLKNEHMMEQEYLKISLQEMKSECANPIPVTMSQEIGESHGKRTNFYVHEHDKPHTTRKDKGLKYQPRIEEKMLKDQRRIEEKALKDQRRKEEKALKEQRRMEEKALKDQHRRDAEFFKSRWQQNNSRYNNPRAKGSYHGGHNNSNLPFVTNKDQKEENQPSLKAETSKKQVKMTEEALKMRARMKEEASRIRHKMEEDALRFKGRMEGGTEDNPKAT